MKGLVLKMAAVYDKNSELIVSSLNYKSEASKYFALTI